MKKEKIDQLRKQNQDLIDTAKKENRELSPMEKELFESRLQVITFEEASPDEKPENETRSGVNPDDVETETRSIKQNEAKIVIKEENDKKVSTETRAIAAAIMEKRVIAIGSNGDSQFSQKVFEVAGNRTDVLGYVTIEENAAPNTKFPLFSPNLDNVKRVSEDGTGSAASTTAFVPVVVTPAPYLAYVPLTDSFIKQDPAGAVGKLGVHFNKAFLRRMAKETVVGSGVGEMLGIFVDATITNIVTCAAAGEPTLKDLLALTAKLTGKFLRSELEIIINPLFWNAICAEDTKHTFVNNDSDYFTFNGIKVIEDDNVPAVVTSGTKVAAIGNLGDYGIARAQNVEIENLGKVAGSLNSNIQGVSYFDGKPIVPSSFAVLETK